MTTPASRTTTTPPSPRPAPRSPTSTPRRPTTTASSAVTTPPSSPADRCRRGPRQRAGRATRPEPARCRACTHRCEPEGGAVTDVAVPITAAGPAAKAVAVVDLGLRACEAYDRPDAAARLTAARRALADPVLHVVVAGEFKQGKSSLVNALVGAAVCPVDDDVATALPTYVR